MKKTIVALLIFVLCFSLFGCGETTISQADYDELQAEYEDLQSRYNKLIRDNNELKEMLVDRYANNDERAADTDSYESTDELFYPNAFNKSFSFQAVHGFVGEDAKRKLVELWGYGDTYDQDTENGELLYIVEYHINLLKDCTRDDLWSILGSDLLRAPSMSAGSVGTAYTLVWDDSLDLYVGSQITAYGVAVFEPDCTEYYTAILDVEYGDYFFVHHVIEGF